jgi:hypothetical protein
MEDPLKMEFVQDDDRNSATKLTSFTLWAAAILFVAMVPML